MFFSSGAEEKQLFPEPTRLAVGVDLRYQKAPDPMTCETLSDAARGRFSASEERAILTITCLAAFLFFNSFGSIGVALPTIQKQFGNSWRKFNGSL